jgi:cytochrome c peroxidase
MMNPRYVAVTLFLLACDGDNTVSRDASVDAVVHEDTHSHDTSVSDVRDVVRPRDVVSRCVGGTALPYPDVGNAIDLGVPLPDMRFEGESQTVALHDWYAPCETRPRLLIVRTLAVWSGPSQYAAAHTSRVLSHPMSDRFALLDLVALNADNTPASRADLAAWRSQYDRVPTELAVDPGYQFQTLYVSAGELPLYVFVDTRSMQISRIVPNPSGADLAYTITEVFNEIDGIRTPPAARPTLYDARFTPEQWDMIRAMSPVVSPPPDPTNRVADDPRAATLGERLFADTGLSSGGVSCATCHAREMAFSDGRSRAMGAAVGDRNTPALLGAAYTRWRFWDGRVDTLWGQAVGPIENPLEMSSTRLAVAHHIAETYATEYTAVFGALPPLNDMTRFPSNGRSGDAQWEAMTVADREAVDRVFVNVGKSIAAFERTLRAPTTAFDRYAMGDITALTTAQRDGLHHYFEGGCIQCHYGPMMTNDSFHNIGMPTGRRDGMPDRGRIDAMEGLAALPFRSDSVFSDDPTRGAHLNRLSTHPMQLGQFHTPTLRQISRTGPWGHGGTFATLAEVVRHYSQGNTMPPVATTIGTRDIHLPAFHMTESTINELASFLEAL